MALNDDAVITAAVGYIFTAPVGTTLPTAAEVDAFDPETDGDTFLVNWTSVGHTSRDELPEFGFDGGDTEVRGTWQNATFREVVTETIVDFVTFQVHQFDENALTLYYGVANASGAAGVFAVNAAPNSTQERALLIIIVDGGVHVGFGATRTSIRRDDSISLENDNFAALPLRATFLKQTGASLYEWISADTGINPGGV